MSCHIKINNWAGQDPEDATSRIAKVFRMGIDEADSVMQKVAQGQSWQFQWTISDEQCDPAHDYLTGLGFDLELIKAEAPYGPGAAAERADEESAKPSLTSWFSSLFKKSGKAAPANAVEVEEKPKSKSFFGFLGKKSKEEQTAEDSPPDEPEATEKKSLFHFSSKKAPEAPPNEISEPAEEPQRKSLFGFLKKK
ncbi:MAG: hypothetical protein V3U37_05510 [Nitrospinaceae bacterium]